jgi:hypothetical protein
MRDLTSPRLIWLKAALLLLIGLLSGGLLLAELPTWRAALLLGLCVWGFCRAYYFAFYVVEHYLDPGYRFAGLLNFAAKAWRRWRVK